MANRSDALRTNGLTRYQKRFLSWAGAKYKDEHERGEIKRLMISAQARYVEGKNRRPDVPAAESSSDE